MAREYITIGDLTHKAHIEGQTPIILNISGEVVFKGCFYDLKIKYYDYFIKYFYLQDGYLHIDTATELKAD